MIPGWRWLAVAALALLAAASPLLLPRPVAALAALGAVLAGALLAQGCLAVGRRGAAHPRPRLDGPRAA